MLMYQQKQPGGERYSNLFIPCPHNLLWSASKFQNVFSYSNTSGVFLSLLHWSFFSPTNFDSNEAGVEYPAALGSIYTRTGCVRILVSNQTNVELLYLIIVLNFPFLLKLNSNLLHLRLRCYRNQWENFAIEFNHGNFKIYRRVSVSRG